MQYTISEDTVEIEGKTFTGDIGARQMHADGKPYHTFRTYTVLADGNNITFRNCMFENTAGPGSKAGQAIALYLDGDNISLYNCILKGAQDTLFLAPLPPKEYEKDGFLGPKQYTPRTNRTFYFKNCIIEGSVDFVFGGATAFFENCDFVSNDAGYVFAPCTPEETNEGFVVRNCRFLRKNGVPDGSVYLARPWRNFAKVTIENCFLDSHIHPEGFSDWNKPDAHHTVVFKESGSYGPGALNTKRPEWVRS